MAKITQHRGPVARPQAAPIGTSPTGSPTKATASTPDSVRMSTHRAAAGHEVKRAGMVAARLAEPPLRQYAVQVEQGPKGLVGRVMGDADGKLRTLKGSTEVGAVVIAEGRANGALQVRETLAAPESAKAKLYAIAAKHGLSPTFPPEVMAEVSALEKAPGLDEPGLKDWRNLAFVTIDNQDSRDLDQAMFIRRREGGGYQVMYALADASYYIKPGTALHAEAMARGVTYYFPAFSIPMLPPQLSEGIVSLNPNVDRRAFCTIHDLDEAGREVGRRFERGVIRSQAKLSYDGVQAFHDGKKPELDGQPYTETLQLLRELGEKRIGLADERDVVRIQRDEVRASVDPEDERGFVVRARGRHGVEKWNEQVSLLCNASGARFLEEPGNAPWVTPIYRIHPEPIRSRLDDFAKLVDGLIDAHRLERSDWTWDRKGGESLADYLDKLPLDGPHAKVTAAIHRQAVMTNQASEFSAEPGLHHGIGVDPYARFSSPMREMVGIYTHKEALEKLSGEAPKGWVRDSEATRAEMVDLANRSAKLQKKIAKEADKLVLDHFLSSDLAIDASERPARSGTILGMSAKKIYVRFDDPPFEVKLYVPDLEKEGATLALEKSGAMARSSNPEVVPDLRVGDAIAVRVSDYDAAKDRYRFELA